MKRGGSVNRLKSLLEEMKKDFSFIRISVIIGHPGESEEDFEELKNFLEEFEFDRVNIFAYSDEEDTAAFKRNDKIDEKTIAVMIELIQGEGGVNPFDINEIQELAKKLKEKDILLIVDEVQTGIYRTGEFLASNLYKIKPDIITMAKG